MWRRLRLDQQIFILAIGAGQPREYVFVFSACIALLGIAAGLWAALVGALVSFVLADYYCVPPVRTFTLVDRFVAVNLDVLAGPAAVVGAASQPARCRRPSRAARLWASIIARLPGKGRGLRP